MIEDKREVKTNKRYSLFVKGVLTLNWNDLEFLQAALITVQNTYGTYITYNESGIKHYQNERLENEKAN